MLTVPDFQKEKETSLKSNGHKKNESPYGQSSCKSSVLQHPINIIHIINSRKLQKIKMRPRTANQSDKIPKIP
jgi:hypothetical protein